MQKCSVTVRIRDSANHVVTGKIVTVPEIQVLQSLHGGRQAVTDIVPLDFEKDFDHDAERQRLRSVYERGNGNADEVHGLIAKLFGPMGRLPTTLKAIGYDPKAIAEGKRAAAARLMAEADAVEAAPQEDHEWTEDEIEAMEALEAREVDEAMEALEAREVDEGDDEGVAEAKAAPPARGRRAAANADNELV